MCDKKKKRLNSTKEKVVWKDPARFKHKAGWKDPSTLQTRGGMFLHSLILAVIQAFIAHLPEGKMHARC